MTSLLMYWVKKMARGVNKVILVGNLGGDPECKSMPNGNTVTNITVATSESWKDKQTGQQKERTEWHRVVFFNRLAEIAAQYLKKGSKVYIEGSLRTRKWQDQNGGDRYTTDIVASEMQMLDSKQQATNEPPQHQGYQQHQPQTAAYAQQAPHQQPNNQYQNQKYGQQDSNTTGSYPSQPVQGGHDFDDEIPFS